MQANAILNILGLLLMVSSITMLPPIGVSLLYGDGEWTAFLTAMIINLMLGLLLWLPARRFERHELRLRDGFIIVVMFWMVLGFGGAVPLLISNSPHLSMADAVFESISGLTTTGATVITGLDDLPKSILYYRQQLQWLGGMGIVVLAVAVMPMLGIGGMQLYRAETPGPMKDNKLTPRITETAKALWYIYLGLTGACAAAYWAAGMDWFDAIGHSFATVAIGGFSTHDLSIGFYNSPLIEGIAIFFMLLAGINFSLHFLAWRSFNLAHYFADEEFKAYIKILLIMSVITVVYLLASDTFANDIDSFRHGLFQAVSLGTTTGFTTSPFQSWPTFLPVMLVMMSFIGACAGSTGGGMKVIRALMLFKQGNREVIRLVHPNAQVLVKIGNKVLDDRVVEAVWGFFSLYIACFIVIALTLTATGLDFVTAFSAVAACMNNLGPGLGDVSAHYGDINDLAKWVLCFAMLLGRLEIFTLLVILSPAFWRR